MADACYAATSGSVNRAGQRWGHSAREAGSELQSRSHAVADGAEWIRLQPPPRTPRLYLGKLAGP